MTELIQKDDLKVFVKISKGQNSIHKQRAQALLLIQNGSTQKNAAEETKLSMGQLRYCYRRYKNLGIALFPKELLEKETLKQKDKKVVKVKKENTKIKDKKKDKKKKNEAKKEKLKEKKTKNTKKEKKIKKDSINKEQNPKNKKNKKEKKKDKK